MADQTTRETSAQTLGQSFEKAEIIELRNELRERENRLVLSRLFVTTLIVWLFGTIVLVFAAFGTSGQVVHGTTYGDRIANSLLIAGAAFILGNFIGFLFGIPQTTTSTEDDSVSDANKDSVRTRSPKKKSFPNPLQQIADWLVKILLGAGLTQLGNVTRIGDYLGKLTGTSESAMVIVAYFFVVGIFFGYMFTTLYLARLIMKALNEIYGDLEDEVYALKSLRTTLKQTLDINEVEYLLFRSLYDDPPKGFEQAILRGEAYLQQDESGTADIFGHLACAYGQKYAWKRMKRVEPGNAEMKTILSKAVEYGRKAKDLDIEWSLLLQDVYNAQPKAVDNDWTTFKTQGNDPDGIVASFIKELQAPRKS